MNSQANLKNKKRILKPINDNKSETLKKEIKKTYQSNNKIKISDNITLILF